MMPYGNCGDYYGRGDYYRGDYYRGDPGFLGGLGKALGGIAKGLAGGIIGTVTGGPLGGIVGAAKGFGLKLPGGVGTPPPIVGPIAPFAQPAFTGAFGPAQALLAPAGALALQQPVGTMLPGAGGFIPGCQLKGTRPNKSSYYKRIPGTLQGQLIPKGSVCVKTRRMNIANGRALRRAVRRAQGFAKMARRVLTFVSAKAPKGRAKFKRGR